MLDCATVLFPADYFKPRLADEHFLPEASAARALGLAVAVFDDQAFTADGRFVPRGLPDAGSVLYRGWMLRSEQYRQLADAVTARGLSLVTSADAYRTAHELPGWYPSFAGLTPRSVWSGVEVDELLAGLAQFDGPVIVKDYVKSLKHLWDEACFIPQASDHEAALKIVRRFVELRDVDLVGGIVLREFEQLRGPELRTWWVDGECLLTTAHPDSADTPVVELPTHDAREAVKGLDARFVTLDYALDERGRWRVVEVGDGQVSDRPASVEAERFLRALVATTAV